MKTLIYLIIFFASTQVCSQSLSPSVFNTYGGNETISSASGSVTIYYNIGEPIYDDIQNTSSNIRLTQGFLQPDIVGSGVLQIQNHNTPMSCYSANDAAIVLNVFGANAPFKFQWYKNGTLLSDTNSYLMNLAVGSYSYSVSDSKGNLRSAIVQITSGEGVCKLIIHNGISANNDGYNDFFHIEHIEDYPDNTVAIFNRWGNLVWNGEKYDNTNVVWKGIDMKGNMLSAGTYFYIVTINGKPTTGWVELMH